MDLSMEVVKNFRHKLNNNFIFSPFSMNILLGIVACGLKTGPNLDRLLPLLGFKTLDDLKAKFAHDHDKLKVFAENFFEDDEEEEEEEEWPILSSINGSWIDKKYRLNPSFHHVLQNLYHAESFTLDFENKTKEAIDEINGWGEKANKGLIKKFIEYDDNQRDTALVLANALYFKAAWLDQFDESNTRSENFHTLNGDIVQVPYMCRGCERFAYASFDGFKVLSLYYTACFTMYIFLPDEKDGLLNLLNQISSNPDLLNLQFKFQVVEVGELMIPKFKFESKFNVSENMEQLGLSIIPQDLDEMLEAIGHENTPSYKMNIFQSFSFYINEHGTEAAAVTKPDSFEMYFDAPPRMDFIADHPFAFLVKQGRSKATIFLGAVVNPLD